MQDIILPPLTASKNCTKCIKINTFYIKVQEIASLSLIEKLISSAIVCDKLRLK